MKEIYSSHDDLQLYVNNVNFTSQYTYIYLYQMMTKSSIKQTIENMRQI